MIDSRCKNNKYFTLIISFFIDIYDEINFSFSLRILSEQKGSEINERKHCPRFSLVLPPSFFLYAPFPLRIVHWERCLIKFSPASVRVSIVRRHIVQFVLQRLFYVFLYRHIYPNSFKREKACDEKSRTINFFPSKQYTFNNCRYF